MKTGIFFLKKRHSEIFGPRKNFPSPQIRRQVSAYVSSFTLQRVISSIQLLFAQEFFRRLSIYFRSIQAYFALFIRLFLNPVPSLPLSRSSPPPLTATASTPGKYLIYSQFSSAIFSLKGTAEGHVWSLSSPVTYRIKNKLCSRAYSGRVRFDDKIIFPFFIALLVT